MDREKELEKALRTTVEELERLHYLHARPGAMFEGKVGEPDKAIIRRAKKVLEVVVMIIILATIPAFAQKDAPVRPIHLPALQAPRYTAPKPVAVQMPRPAKNAYRFPVIKTVHMPAPHYR